MTQTQARILLAVIGYLFFCWLVPIVHGPGLSYLQAVVACHIAVGLLGSAILAAAVILRLAIIAFPDISEDK